jgi:hypothetical protein
VQQVGEETGQKVTSVAGKAAQFTGAVRETLVVGRSASLRRAERIARREGNRTAADTARAAREELGDVSADELPIKGFDSLSTADAVKAVKELTSAHDVRVIIRYEETHKKRSSVISAAQTTVAGLAKEAVGIAD